MSTNEVIDIINTICDKLGIVCNSVADFMPYLVRAKIAECTYWMVVSLILAILSGVWLLWCIKRARRLRATSEWYEWSDYPGLCAAHIASATTLVICAIEFFCYLASMIRWIYAPEAATVNYILSFLN